MRILFISPNQLNTNNGIHILNLANSLTHLGVECSVCILDELESEEFVDFLSFEVIDFKEARKLTKAKHFDIIHAWTPRESIRLVTEELVSIFNCPYIVHLEDNEEHLLEVAFGESFAYLEALSIKRLDNFIPPHLSHPIRYKNFLSNASGISIIIDTLIEFCPPNKPTRVIWPGYDSQLKWNLNPNPKLRDTYKIKSEEIIITYTGNVHAANKQEVFSLYLAIGLLNRSGFPVKLIRTGLDSVTLIDKQLIELNKYIINLNSVKRIEIPMLLSLADILVQPGKSDPFNNYRFPSKIPEFLASGKPVLLPATNIGNSLKNGENCVLLFQGHALEIAHKLETLFKDKPLQRKIGVAGRHFAEKNLRWEKSARLLLGFYKRILYPFGNIQSDKFSPSGLLEEKKQ